MIVTAAEFNIVYARLKAGLDVVLMDTAIRRYKLETDWNDEEFIKELQKADLIVSLFAESVPHGNARGPTPCWYWNTWTEQKMLSSARRFSHTRMIPFVDAATDAERFIHYLTSTCDGGYTMAERGIVDSL